MNVAKAGLVLFFFFDVAKAQVLFSRAMDVAPAYSKGAVNYASLLHTYKHPGLWTIRTGYVGWFTIFGRQVPFNTRWAKKIGFEFVMKDDSRTRYYAE